MTQSYIRRAAGWGPVRRSWGKLHEPRIISSIYGGWWTLAVVLGGYSIFHPPRTVEAVAGDVLMSIVAGLIAVSGAIGVVSVAKGAYWTERYAVKFAIPSLLVYIGVVAYLWWESEGNRGLQIFGLTGAVLFTGIRLYWVNQRPYSERRGALNQAVERDENAGGNDA